jgi:hypothetical protein
VYQVSGSRVNSYIYRTLVDRLYREGDRGFSIQLYRDHESEFLDVRMYVNMYIVEDGVFLINLSLNMVSGICITIPIIPFKLPTGTGPTWALGIKQSPWIYPAILPLSPEFKSAEHPGHPTLCGRTNAQHGV